MLFKNTYWATKANEGRYRHLRAQRPFLACIKLALRILSIGQLSSNLRNHGSHVWGENEFMNPVHLSL